MPLKRVLLYTHPYALGALVLLLAYPEQSMSVLTLEVTALTLMDIIEAEDNNLPVEAPTSYGGLHLQN
tara:strand:- start:734 stop:937 length:204 start_codon:yes stop_codon:yes gene_type:complete